MILLLLAAAAAFAFQPPADPVRYRTTHIRPGPQGPLHVSIDKTLRFTAHGDGWRATLTVTDVATDAPPPAAATIRAGLDPFRGVPVTVEVDRQGQAGAVIDGAAAWRKVVASFDAVAASLAERGVPVAAQAGLRAALHRAGDIDRAAQDARLREPVAELIGPHTATPPAQLMPATATYRILESDGADVRTAVTVSRTTGLVVERRVERRLPSPGGIAEAVEETRQIP